VHVDDIKLSARGCHVQYFLAVKPRRVGEHFISRNVVQSDQLTWQVVIFDFENSDVLLATAA
jgi:hypothetical protein